VLVMEKVPFPIICHVLTTSLPRLYHAATTFMKTLLRCYYVQDDSTVFRAIFSVVVQSWYSLRLDVKGADEDCPTFLVRCYCVNEDCPTLLLRCYCVNEDSTTFLLRPHCDNVFPRQHHDSFEHVQNCRGVVVEQEI
jgi:hypothetical protein